MLLFANMNPAFLGYLLSERRFVDITVSGWAWAALAGLILALLVVDLCIFHRHAHVVSLGQAATRSALWVAIGLLFAGVIAWAYGTTAAGEYLSGYLIEQSLSVDNVFVWALILNFFVVPPQYQQRVLFWGFLGAVILRAIFIFGGVAVISEFEWTLYFFGLFLLYTAVKLIISKDIQVDLSSSRLLKLIRRFVPTTDTYDQQKLFTKIEGQRCATPLFAVVLLIEFTDVLFAVDSVPAVLAVSREQFIVFSSNAFAILGLRAMYFLLANADEHFVYLKQGLALILGFVGVKMLTNEWYHMPTWLSLAVILAVLVGASSLSVLLTAKKEPPPSHP